jgi:PAS domain S-box-containing protein
MHQQRASWAAVSKWVLTVLAMGLLGSAVIAWVAQVRNEAAAREAFGLLSAQVADRLAKRIQLYEYGLRGVRGAALVAGPDGLTAEIFHQYSESRDIDSEFPGARGFGFIRRVPRDDVGAFLAQARGDGRADFRILQLHGHDGDRFVIQYIEPLARNLPAVGLDVASEGNRRDAAIKAMRSGQAVMTGPISLVQKSGDPKQSVLFLLPIYKAGMRVATVAERELACIGWSYAALSLDEVLSDFQLDNEQFGMHLFDVTNGGPEVLFAMPDQHAVQDKALSRALPLELYGRRWRVELTEHEALRAGIPQTDPVIVFAVGLLMTLLLASLVGLLKLGRERTRVAAAQKGQLATIVENSADAIIGEAMDGTIISWNRAAQRLFGYEESEVVGQPLAALLLPPARRREDKDLLYRIGRGDVLPPFDTTRLHRDGTEIDVSVTAGAMHGENSELIGVAKLMRDIRERKESERQLQDFAANLERQVQERTAALQQARVEAEAASSAKSMFLANMSHEIRTPMNAVIGAAHLLNASTLDDDQRQLLDKIRVASRSLLGIINDVLDLAKIEAGELHVDVHPFDPAQVMDDIQQLFASQAGDKGIVLWVTGQDGLPARLSGDGLRLKQVLVNLVSNAIKFTQQGHVDVSVQRDGTEPDSKLWLRWSVRDTGIGIPADMVERLFAPFAQADASTTRRFGGTGLGLSIVAQLVGMMGGEISVDSAVGHGSEFIVRLPFDVLAEEEAPRTSPQSLGDGSLQGVRILLVDDSDINREIGARVLEREGATVETCANGREAVERLREGADFDAVLMDIQMPVMDGYEATRRIRADLGLTALPILALTAGALSEERRKAEAAGMNEFLTKPLDPLVLVRTLKRVL